MVNKTNKKLLNDLFGYIREKLPDKQAIKLLEFARYYYQSVVFHDIEKIATEDLYGAILSHWNFALDFSSKQKIRVYNPTLEEHGWQSKHTIIEIVVRDTPFLLQSISMEVNRHGFTNHLIIHPVFSIKRDASGKLLSFSDGIENDKFNECLIHLQIDRHSEFKTMESLRHCLKPRSGSKCITY